MQLAQSYTTARRFERCRDNISGRHADTDVNMTRTKHAPNSIKGRVNTGPVLSIFRYQTDNKLASTEWELDVHMYLFSLCNSLAYGC